MCYPVAAIFLLYPVEHQLPAIIVEVDVDVGHGDSVGVEETLEKQLVFDWIHIGDTCGEGDYRTCSRTPARANNHPHLPCCIDKILYNQKVPGEAHGLDHMQFETDPLLGIAIDDFTIPFDGPFLYERFEVICFKLYPEGALIASHPLIIFPELLLQLFFSEFQPVLLHGAKALRNRKFWHDGFGIQLKKLHFVHDLLGIVQHIGQVFKKQVHLGGTLEPLLFGVLHAGRIVEVLAGIEADQQIMGICILLVHKMDIVGGDQLDTVLLCQLDQYLVDTHLLVVNFPSLFRICRWMTLYLEVKIISEDGFVPFNCLFCPG